MASVYREGVTLMTYTSPAVISFGSAIAKTLGGSRISTEGSVKQPVN
jgi:hypothetical protein